MVPLVPCEPSTTILIDRYSTLSITIPQSRDVACHVAIPSAKPCTEAGFAGVSRWKCSITNRWSRCWKWNIERLGSRNGQEMRVKRYGVRHIVRDMEIVGVITRLDHWYLVLLSHLIQLVRRVSPDAVVRFSGGHAGTLVPLALDILLRPPFQLSLLGVDQFAGPHHLLRVF